MMTRLEEIAFSMLLSPAELVIWHSIGGSVAPRRHAELKAELARPHVPENRTRRAKFKRAMQAKAIARARRRYQGLMPGMGRKGAPVVVDGVRYDSAEAAGRALGVHGVTVRRWINCGRPVGKLALKISGKGVVKGAQGDGGNGATEPIGAAAGRADPAGQGADPPRAGRAADPGRGAGPAGRPAGPRQGRAA